MQVVSRLLEAPYLTLARIWDLASLLREHALHEHEQRLRQQAAAYGDALEAAIGTGRAVEGPGMLPKKLLPTGSLLVMAGPGVRVWLNKGWPHGPGSCAVSTSAAERQHAHHQLISLCNPWVQNPADWQSG